MLILTIDFGSTFIGGLYRMSVLTNQTSVNANRSFFEAYGQSSSVPQNILCSTINSVFSITTPTMNASAVNNVNSMNGYSFNKPGVGSAVDNGLDLDTGGNSYRGNNVFFDVTSTNSSNILYLDPVLGGTVGGNFVMVAQEPGNNNYQIWANNNVGVGITPVPIEVIQGTDNTARLYIYSGGQGLNGTGWQKVAGTYTKELINLGGFSNALTAGTQTFTMPNTYSAQGNLQYRVHAQGRIVLTGGVASGNDNCQMTLGMNVNTPPAVVGTTIQMGITGITSYSWNVSGTIYDPVVPLPINTIFTTTQIGGTGTYELYVDSFTVAQL